MKPGLNFSLIVFIISITLCIENTYAQIPYINYSTLLGGSSYDYGHAITVDTNGYAYVAGQANSSNFPTTAGAFDQTFNGNADIYVTKLSVDGSQQIFSTLIGGSGFDDTRAVSIDKEGNVYLTGTAESQNFPSPTAHTIEGTSQYYFLKLRSDGSHLDYISRWAGGAIIIIDREGYAILLGEANSASLQATDGAYDTSYNGNNDLFVAKIDLNKDSILFFTYLGGSGNESSYGNSLHVDQQNNIIVAGMTSSSDFPVKGNSYASYTAGKSNIFITKLKADGSDIIFSCLIGGNDDEYEFGLAVDLSDNLYVSGITYSTDFPVTAGAFDETYNGGVDAFVTKVSSDGSQLNYSTYIGSSDKESGRGITVDKYGKAYVTGCTRSVDFPVTTNAVYKSYSGGGTDQYSWGDAYLVVLNPQGSDLDYATYLGSKNDEEAYDITIDKNGSVYLTGVTSSVDFPTTNDAFQRVLKGLCNIYVTKFSFDAASLNMSVSTNDLTVASGANSKTSFGIVSNTSWKVSSPELWLSFDRKTGLNNDSIVVTAKTNRETSPRTGTITISGSGVNDQTISITQEAKSTGITDSKELEIEVFPNPSRNKICIELNGIDYSESFVKVFSLSGKTLIYQEVNNKTLEINIERMAKGTYLVALFTKDNIYTSKIIRE